MPLTIEPLFKLCTVNQGSKCEDIVKQYYAGKPTLSKDINELNLAEPAIQIFIQRGDKLRAVKTYVRLFPNADENGTSYHLRVPVSYNGDVVIPEGTTVISSPDEFQAISNIINQRGIRLSNLGNSKAIPIPADFDAKRHLFSATPFWLAHNGITPK